MAHLVVIVDCSPSPITSSAQYLQWLDSIITFCNSHLMIEEKNELTVIGSSETSNRILICTKDGVQASDCNLTQSGQFEKFSFITNALRDGIVNLVSNAKQSKKQQTSECMLAEALGIALCRINRIKIKLSRVLVLSCSMQVGCFSSQYMNLMNAFFAAQKISVSIDGCVYMKDDFKSGSILEQGCSLTGGHFLNVPQISRTLECLLSIFLPDESLRESLLLPDKRQATHRAACFCHRNIIDIGYVCSVCLSIFCTFSPICSTCHTHFKINFPSKIINKMNIKK